MARANSGISSGSHASCGDVPESDPLGLYFYQETAARTLYVLLVWSPEDRTNFVLPTENVSILELQLEL
jgi:hypothetical protein